VKAPVKQQQKNTGKKDTVVKKPILKVSQKPVASPLKAKLSASPSHTAITQKKNSTTFLKIKHSAKRQSKLALKNMLLSKAFHVAFKFISIVLLLSAAAYGLYSHFNVTLENDVVVSKSEIIDRVSKLTSLPPGTPDAVVRVQDPEKLKKQNDFYTNVKEGDYIVMYPKMAVIYDLRNNSIISEKRTEK
jgi:hypothetical protein